MSNLFNENLIPEKSWRNIFFSMEKGSTTLNSSGRMVGTLMEGYVSGRKTSTIADAINADGNLIKDVINEHLDTSSKEILSDFDFGSTDYAGALKSGTISWDSNGDNITGSGVAIYRKGIVGAKNGTVTFSINAATGDATFAGTLSSGVSITSPVITGGTITGGTIKTSSGTTRVEMNSSSNELILYQNGYERTVIGSGAVWFGTTTGVGSASIYGYGTNTLAISTGSYGYLMNETQFYPMSSSASLGTSSYPWLNFYVENIRAPSASDLIYLYFGTTAAGYLSYNSGVQVNAAEFLIDCPARTRAIFPKTANTYACGGSGLYWSAVYSYYYYAKHTSLVSFDKHDDIRLLKSVPTKTKKEKLMKGKKEIEKDVEYFDLTDIPEAKGEGDMINLGAVNGLLIGTVKQLIEEVETLKNEITNLKNK